MESGITFQNVGANTLEQMGVAPSSSGQRAHDAAVRQFPGSAILSQTLVHLYKEYQLPPEGKLVWAVSITPPMATVSGGIGTKEIPVRQFLLFIDALTGQFLFFYYRADTQP
jgi:hypothetical protein